MRTRQARIGYSLLVLVMTALLVATGIAVGAVAGTVAAAPSEISGGGWPTAGYDIADTRDAAAEHDIGPGNVSRLATAWSLTTTGSVTVTPTEADGTVYFPDSGGTLWAVAADTGQVRWSHRVSVYTGIAGDVSRTSPAVYGDELVLGDTSPAGTGASVIAVDRRTGQLRWRTLVDPHVAAIITGAAVVYRGVVYEGVSSDEEVLATTLGYRCCSFRGSVVALDAATGKLLWKTYTVPAGYSGGPVWGSTPAIDPEDNLVYVGTGDNYTAPPGVCTVPGETGCASPAADDHVDSVLALDRTTGAVRWFKSTLSSDVFTLVCGDHPTGTCGPDFDFGSGPNLIRLPSGRQILGIGQKSGVYWALDARTGASVWQTMVGPGSSLGGIEWGSATDGRRVYAAISNAYRQASPITSADGTTSITSGGFWAALDAATGKILWQVADPQGAADMGYVSTANGVVYAGSTAPAGTNMYALDAASGRILWRFASGGSVASGAAIARGRVYWGSGYLLPISCPAPTLALTYCPVGNDKFYAFALPAPRR
jgi:polyvinyl alcohol dehydrogenase (cytochrome)